MNNETYIWVLKKNDIYTFFLILNTNTRLYALRLLSCTFKLCDLGISRLVPESGSTSAFTMTGDVGTPGFVAPEMFAGGISGAALTLHDDDSVGGGGGGGGGGRDGGSGGGGGGGGGGEGEGVFADGSDGGNMSVSCVYGSKVDVFSYGVCLWVLWAGRLPYLSFRGSPIQLVLEVCQLQDGNEIV